MDIILDFIKETSLKRNNFEYILRMIVNNNYDKEWYSVIFLRLKIFTGVC